MPPMLAAIPYVAAAATIASTIQSSNAARAQGKAQQQEANYVAAQDTAAGNAAAASGQRAEISQEKQNAVNTSNAIASGANSGTAGSASDNTNLATIGAEGNYRSMTALYNGASKQQAYGNQAAGSTYQGQIDRQAGNIKANTAILSGVSSLFGKYGSTSSDSMDGGSSFPPAQTGYTPTYFTPLTA